MPEPYVPTLEHDDETPFDKLREECGVMAVYNHPDAARLTYWGLYALQHRGQESAGIAVSNGAEENAITDLKGMGLVSEIFTDPVLARLPGAYCDWAYALFDDGRLGPAERAADLGGVDQGADCDCA
jgi:hypothetical protein